MDQRKSGLSRRQLLRNSFLFSGGAAGMLAGRKGFGQILTACGLTPPQEIGPFFPEKQKPDEDTDLTQVAGHTKRAIGQVIFLSGRVQDENCNPISSAEVEIWQADWKGRYDHSGDSDPDPNRPFDPDFQYWGISTSDRAGRYSFKTIIPGHYPAGDGWVRPPHIHFKVTALGHHDLITQMYFAPEAFDFDPDVTPDFIERLNRLDKILHSEVPVGQEDRVTIAFKPTALESGAKEGTFDITMRKVR
jgi:protocatechuate 3,4-dioxygenase beta subunit